jgi:hypothetical protein
VPRAPALTCPICLGLKDRSRIVSSLQRVHYLHDATPARDPPGSCPTSPDYMPASGCCNTLQALHHSIAQQDFTTGDCQASFHPCPARPLSWHLPCRRGDLRPVTYKWHCAIRAALILGQLVCRTSHARVLAPAQWTRMPFIRSRSHGVCS